jgi:tagatose kinase
MKKISTIGEVIVEIMATTVGKGFLEPLPLFGPLPSGAPAIFINQVGMLGQPCAIASCVGDDDFGRVNLGQLRSSGVDVSAVAVSPSRPTGSAFVRYTATGSRNFIFNIAQSACAELSDNTSVEAMVERTDHLHVMGSALFSQAVTDLTLKSLARVKARGGTVSFDPNVRPEMLAAGSLKMALHDVLKHTDLFLPSGNELFLASRSDSVETAVTELLEAGVSAIVHKKGEHGAAYFDRFGKIDQPAYSVREIDPTGAGDCFGATFVTFWLRGASPELSLRMATAAGALAVSKQGPMAGASSIADIERFISKSEEEN